ncbi:unnamed protein product, partial [Nesidiocoris tenuis]
IFPREVYISRLIVAVDLFVVGAIEYVFSLFIEPTTLNAPYLVFGWSALFLCMFLWMGAITVLLPSFNPVRDNTEAVRSRFEGTEVLRYFDQRQEFSCTLRFLCLIYPSIMFSISKEIMTVAIDQYGSSESIVSSYRLHLAVSPLAVIVTTAVLLFWNFSRQESRDLITIGIAHLLNLIFLVVIIVISYNSKFSADKTPIYPNTTRVRESTQDNVGLALIMLRSLRSDGEVFNIAYNDSSGGSINMAAMTGKPNILIAQMFPEAPAFTTSVQGSANGSILFSDEITFTFQQVNTYMERNGRLHLLRHSGQRLPLNHVVYPKIGPVSEFTLTSFTIAPRCYEGPPKDVNGIRILLNKSNCHSMKSWIRFLDGKRNVLSQQIITPIVQDDGTFEPEAVKVGIVKVVVI